MLMLNSKGGKQVQNQLWSHRADGALTLGDGSTKCLEVASGSPANGAQVVLGDCPSGNVGGGTRTAARMPRDFDYFVDHILVGSCPQDYLCQLCERI